MGVIADDGLLHTMPIPHPIAIGEQVTLGFRKPNGGRGRGRYTLIRRDADADLWRIDEA